MTGGFGEPRLFFTCISRHCTGICHVHRVPGERFLQFACKVIKNIFSLLHTESLKSNYLHKSAVCGWRMWTRCASGNVCECAWRHDHMFVRIFPRGVCICIQVSFSCSLRHTHTHTQRPAEGEIVGDERQRSSEAWIMDFEGFPIAAGVWIYWGKLKG